MWNQYSGGTRRKPTIVVVGDAFFSFLFFTFWEEALKQTFKPNWARTWGWACGGFGGPGVSRQFPWQTTAGSIILNWLLHCSISVLYLFWDKPLSTCLFLYDIKCVLCDACVCARVNAWCVMPDILNERYGMVEFFNDGGCQGPLNS